MDGFVWVNPTERFAPNKDSEIADKGFKKRIRNIINTKLMESMQAENALRHTNIGFSLKSLPTLLVRYKLPGLVRSM